MQHWCLAGLAVAIPTMLSIATDMQSGSKSRYTFGLLSLAGGLGSALSGVMSSFASGEWVNLLCTKLLCMESEVLQNCWPSPYISMHLRP
jgi:hypothetical protein